MNEQIIEVIKEYTEAVIEVTGEQVERTISVETEAINVFNAPLYTGSYEFTPSDRTQTVEIDGKRAEGNITINPIPSNYGLITWNGSTLTVS